MKRIRKNWRNMAAVNAALTGATQGRRIDQREPKIPQTAGPPTKLTSLAELGEAWRKRRAKMNGDGNGRR
jgi:hypothetical protein